MYLIILNYLTVLILVNYLTVLFCTCSKA